MEEKNKKSKNVCTPFDEHTYNLLKAKAGNTQSIASIIRVAVVQYLGEEATTTVKQVVPLAHPITIESKPAVSSLIVAKYDTEDTKIVYGPPTVCPVCKKTHNELGNNVMQIVNSGVQGKGAWACYECYSSGRWSNDEALVILKNTQLGDNDTTFPEE